MKRLIISLVFLSSFYAVKATRYSFENFSEPEVEKAFKVEAQLVIEARIIEQAIKAEIQREKVEAQLVIEARIIEQAIKAEIQREKVENAIRNVEAFVISMYR